ncbi:MAG: laccase domain-containing protein [Chlamydiae bacterium]|jgi:YfiH family protein|nr:laccase domain-containing protein [Chlamydiota bacterium]
MALMGDLVQLSNFNNLYPYPIQIPKISYGSFLKSQPLPLIKTETFQEWVQHFKKNFSLNRVIYLNQTHSDHIYLVNQLFNSSQVLEGDALITQEKKCALLAFHADCQVCFVYDPKTEAIGIVHAGFRGQIQKIYSKMIHRMQREMGVNVKDLMVFFSPSLCQKHAEFIHYEKEFPPKLWIYKDHLHRFDLKKMGLDEWIDLGVKKSNIFTNSDCTYENVELFYSYRQDKTPFRHVSYVFLNE